MKSLFFLLLALFALTFDRAVAQPIFVPVQGESGKSSLKMYDVSKALVIGQTEYDAKAGWRRLPKVEEEVAIVDSVLKEHGFAVTIERNLKGEALRRVIRAFLLQNNHRDTRLIVYFAGHGWTRKGALTGYIVPSDAPNVQDGALEENLTSLEEIRTWSLSSPAKHVLMVFNSCFSGSVFITRSNLVPDEVFVRDLDAPGRMYISAGTERDEVPDSTQFAELFALGLRGEADIYRDGIITAQELGYFLRAEGPRARLPVPQYGPVFDPRFRKGETVFLNPRRNSLNMKIARLDPPVGDHRQPEMRSAGKPVADKTKIFEDLDVFYYRKRMDSHTVTAALNDRKIPYSVTQAAVDDDKGVNAIACGPDTPPGALRALGLALLDGGVNLKAVLSFRQPQLKPRRVELLTLTDRGARPVLGGARNLTRAEIENLSGCPEFLQGGAAGTSAAMPPPADGWVYYEISQSREATLDSQLIIFESEQGVPFRSLRKGTTLKALSVVNVREKSPKTQADLRSIRVVHRLKKGECVTTVEAARPEEEVRTQEALSGGWLRVRRTSCQT